MTDTTARDALGDWNDADDYLALTAARRRHRAYKHHQEAWFRRVDPYYDTPEPPHPGDDAIEDFARLSDAIGHRLKEMGVDEDDYHGPGSKRRLTLVDWRLAATSANDSTWVRPEWEDGVAVVKVSFTTTSTGFKLSTVPHSVVSAHAIARWYDRGGKRDDESLVRDVTALLTSGERDRVSCASGTWLSNVVIAHDSHGRMFKVRDIRTFVQTHDTPTEADNVQRVTA